MPKYKPHQKPKRIKKLKYPAPRKKWVREVVIKRYPVPVKYYDPPRVLNDILQNIDESIKKNQNG